MCDCTWCVTPRLVVSTPPRFGACRLLLLLVNFTPTIQAAPGYHPITQVGGVDLEISSTVFALGGVVFNIFSGGALLLRLDLL
ncbi:unnamed protein product [Ectocarpus sp. 6 AP-2014]